MVKLNDLTDSALVDLATNFLNNYQNTKKEYVYVNMIDQMMHDHNTYIIIDYNDIITSDEIERRFKVEPDRIINALIQSVIIILSTRYPKYAKKIKDSIRIRVSNYPIERSLRTIDADVINKMTSVRGMVVRASDVKPLAVELIYVCDQNHQTIIYANKNLTIRKPTKCSDPKCGSRDVELRSEISNFINFQIIRMQELPEDLPPGQLPHYVDIVLKRDLVHNARPGDRVILTGIARIEQEYAFNSKNNAIYQIRLDAINIEFTNNYNQSGKSNQREMITHEEEQMIKKLAVDKNIYEKLVNSFAPHIFGHEIIKEAILLLIIGSTQKILENNTKIRGDINIFLVGDPGAAKSELLKFCAKIAPRGLYTSGRGSTAAGLTAAVVRDKSGIMMLEAGAVVLGDQGLVCIDEFDKMKPEDRSALHEVMEQQSASIAKGGIVTTLNARTSILAAANPMYGKYDPFKNITENVNLPIPILTRFDLIFVVRDVPAEDRDKLIAQHIVNLHNLGNTEKRTLISSDIMTKYIIYAKNIKPVLTKEAEELIIDYYMKMRKVDSEQTLTITPRQLEGLIRLSTAHARILLKKQVEKEDAERAIELMQSMLQDVGVDVNTGEVDMGVIHGKPKSEISKMQIFMDVLKTMSDNDNNSILEKDFIDELVKTGKYTSEEAETYITKMKSNAIIYEPKIGYINKV